MFWAGMVSFQDAWHVTGMGIQMPISIREDRKIQFQISKTLHSYYGAAFDADQY